MVTEADARAVQVCVVDHVVLTCHLCGKEKEGRPWRALYEMAFHYDRRHNGWTHGTVLS